MEWSIRPLMPTKQSDKVYNLLFQSFMSRRGSDKTFIADTVETNETHGITLVNRACMASFESLVKTAMITTALNQLAVSYDWLDEKDGYNNMLNSISDKDAIDRKIKTIVTQMGNTVGELDPGLTKNIIKTVTGIIDKIRLTLSLEIVVDALKETTDK